MDKCLPVVDLFHSSRRTESLGDDVPKSPLIIEDMSLFYYRQLAESLQDNEMQQKIDHEIKMREGAARLLAASKHPNQLMEAAKNLLASNTRIVAYMSELQRRKTVQVLGKNVTNEGSQLPCKARLNLSDLRIPLMWRDTDHFKNKGDHRRYAVFCLVKIGTDIQDTALITNVDRNMTDLSFEEVIAFDDIPHDFECTIEIYCHKLHEDLTIASTPKKLKKKVVNLSESVGRSVGKRLSGLNDSDIMGNMVLGPKFDLVASGALNLHDVDDVVRTFDLKLEVQSDTVGCEMPLFGHYCCRLAALPNCLVQPVVNGYLSLREDDDLAKWRRYWCILKNLQLSCWSAPDDVDVTAPLVTVPVTKNTQISEADPRTSQRSHTFHVKTLSERFVSEATLAADNLEQFNLWWDGLQQHLLDQAFWKQACEYVMDVRRGQNRRTAMLMRKTSLYDDVPLAEPRRISDELKVEDDKLSAMLNTLMGEAKEIRSGSIKSTSSSSCGSLRSTSSS
ncbi:rhotekin-like isoform X2 [Dreissena polymorpha]|uniref:rhotekin-like isoform X2 n=1 Tax=Dreissena polymorpha TaxID=45954 RepID=UPI002263EB8D|nr:rhotekin-like isoform X2 [Dreissena polymorpha]XP_052250593.1 rhotekin-like isoform X2 [Dreissena polymorpha]XP_052250594.1 rhotekin-like isoform X2 [Dreissena polymorpha]XP_052250595.1 rhotekin-like isoform X2 [Dreissena polymorpha]XP_052250596.1 rhotekin-like isoform X2 [Dreissena polymorpha]